MSHKGSHHLLITAAIGAACLVLTGCGGSEAASSASSQPTTAASAPGADTAIRDLLPQRILDSGTLRVGATTTNPPFSLKQNQELEGLIPDLAAEIEGLTGVEVDFVETARAGDHAVVAITDSLSSPLQRHGVLPLLVSEVDVGAFRALSATFALAITLAVALGARRGAALAGG